MRTELKAEWPTDFAKAARQIAGHANAAGDEPVLWLIGVDEVRGVVDFALSEFSDWYNQLARQFDALPPRITPLVVPYNDKRPVALLIETDRAPFVVKNAAHNTPGGGSVQWETPWRAGNSVRSARRADLLRLLSPLQTRPDVEIRGASASASVNRGSDSYHFQPGIAWDMEIPAHRCSGVVSLPGVIDELVLPKIDLWAIGISKPSTSSVVRHTEHQIILHEPTLVRFTAQAASPDYRAWHSQAELALRISLGALDLEVPLLLEATLSRTADRLPIPPEEEIQQSHYSATWSSPKEH